MKPNLKTLSLFTAAGGLLALAIVFGRHDEADKPVPKPDPIVTTEEAPVVQIALLLDTSNSMDGLIDQAKSQLWKIVNAFDPAKLNGKRPRLEIALYEYGNDNLTSASGYVRQVLPFTEELDRVSEALFALSTNGGSEFVGQALKTALENLEWSHANDALKFAFIAGNENFDQGPIDPDSVVRLAATQGIVVNTIYCGPEQDSVASGWRNGAALAEGRFMTIDQNQKIVQIDAPQDGRIAELSLRLNETYIPFGHGGSEGARRQAVEDQNSATVGQGSAIQRGLFKSSQNYKNPSWELGDALREGKVDLANVDREQLPANMRAMSIAERQAYVQEQVQKRETIQAEIQKLAHERDGYVSQQQKKMAENTDTTLDTAMIQAVQGQASKKGYKF